jgi:hypothetical protein
MLLTLLVDTVLTLFRIFILTVPITTKVVSLNPIYGEVYSIQNYVIKFISDLGQVGGFHWVLQFSPPIKLTIMI